MNLIVMERIDGETMVLYADLRERLEAFEAMRSIASLPGKFTTKTIKGMDYHYFQTILPGGRTQISIGPDGEEVRRLIKARESGEHDMFADEKMLQRLASQVIAGGVIPIVPMMARIINRLADCGVFRVGGLLVNTVAYQVLGPHLVVIWRNGSRMTQERDATAADKKRKDILQAGNMITLLKEDRPGDIELAREDLVKPGTSWIKKVEAACTEANIKL